MRRSGHHLAALMTPGVVAVVVAWAAAMAGPLAATAQGQGATGPGGIATPMPTQPVDWPDLPAPSEREPVAVTEHFRLATAADDPLLEGAAERWARHVESIGLIVQARLGLPHPAEPTTVLFARAYDAPCPARGLAYSRSGDGPVVAVFIDENTSDVQVRAVLAHEIGHAFTFEDGFVGDGVLTEGIANWAGGDLVRTWQAVERWDEVPRTALGDGRYVSIADPAGLQPRPDEDCLARRDRVYNLRAAFTEWLVNRVGIEVVRSMPSQVVSEAREGSDEPRTRSVPDYRRATGFTLEQLETIWLAEVSGQL